MSKDSKKKRNLKNKKTTKKSPATLTNLLKFRKKYIPEWNITSSFFDEQGYYTWMSNQVSGYEHILEIGCGVGYSTLALLKNGHSVTSIEENPECIDATKLLLEKNGFSVKTIKRGIPLERSPERYEIIYNHININSTENFNALIIEGDALTDEKLVKWLSQNKKFDAVVCWLLGTHNYRGNNIRIDLNQIRNAFEHRIYVQNKVYELADIILRDDGVLNVIDRAQYPDDQRIIDGYMDSHKDQASVTNLIVENKLEFIKYEEPKNSNATQMMVTIPTEKLEFDPNKMAMLSVISKKPNQTLLNVN